MKFLIMANVSDHQYIHERESPPLPFSPSLFLYLCPTLSFSLCAPLPVPALSLSLPPLSLSPFPCAPLSLFCPLSLFLPPISLSPSLFLSHCPLPLSLSAPSLFPYHCCSLPLPLSLCPLSFSLCPLILSLPLSAPSLFLFPSSLSAPLSPSLCPPSLFHYTLLSLSRCPLFPLYISLCPLSLPPPPISLSAPLSLPPSLSPSLCPISVFISLPLSRSAPLSFSPSVTPLSLPPLYFSLCPLFPSALLSLCPLISLSLSAPCLSFSLAFSLVIPDISIYLTACTLVLIQYASRLLDRYRDQQAWYL